LEKNPLKRSSASECLRLPAVLKSEQIHKVKIVDDFDVQLVSISRQSSSSCKQINIRSSEASTCGNESPLPLLKYFCFVA